MSPACRSAASAVDPDPEPGKDPRDAQRLHGRPRDDGGVALRGAHRRPGGSAAHRHGPPAGPGRPVRPGPPPPARAARAAPAPTAGRKPPTTEEFAAGYGYKKWTTDLGQALADPEVDVAIIAGPSETHAQMPGACREAGK